MTNPQNKSKLHLDAPVNDESLLIWGDDSHSNSKHRSKRGHRSRGEHHSDTEHRSRHHHAHHRSHRHHSKSEEKPQEALQPEKTIAEENPTPEEETQPEGAVAAAEGEPTTTEESTATEEATPEEELTPEEQKQRKRKRVRKIILRVLLILLLVLLGLALILGGILVWMYYQGKSELLNDTPPNIKPPEELVEYYDEDQIVYKGTAYKFNENVTAVLVVGVDKQGLLEESVYGKNGQADSLFLATLDTENGDIHIIPLSRETMVDVDQYAVDGTFLGVKRTQLCLAYSYGSNGEQGCENVVRSVSRLLYGVPINSYIAIDMDGVKAMTDAIGGVPVTGLEDIDHPYFGYNITRKGQTTTLNGKDALAYMRHRDDDAEANNRRMQRLKQFFTAFIKRSGSKLKSDLTLLPSYYNTAKPYTVTNINLSKITYLVGCTLTGNNWKNPSYHSIAGQAVKGEKYTEFYADTASAFEAVLAAYYKPVGPAPSTNGSK